MDNHETAKVVRLMNRFSEATGLVGNREPRRYLWTDAFAVCNFLELERRAGDGRYLNLALALVDQVHEVLGQHRPDDARSGWLSGKADGRENPTAGGLRIGKPLPERKIQEPHDEQREWDQDGQYYHYLTKWAHALHRVAKVTGRPDYRRWASELNVVAHRSFRAERDPPRLYWKMSVDLSYPLVTSSSHHDPMDGLVTCLCLRSATAANDEQSTQLDNTIEDLVRMCRTGHWVTTDALGLGSLLFDAARVLQLPPEYRVPHGLDLLPLLLSAAEEGLRQYARSSTQQLPASRRLAFRELGLSIGLAAIASIAADDRPEEVDFRLTQIGKHLDLGQSLVRYWSLREHQDTRAWREHEDINSVMLATSLLPNGFI